jgi:DNA ligase D-like protein (predicted polymerase)
MASRTTQQAKVGGRELTFSNLEKVLWPRDGYTKGDLIAYYLSVAKWLLPHVKDRPLTLQRYPDGVDGQSFFEKQAPRFTPEWIRTVALSADQGSRKVAYILCNDEATLAWCANLAAIVLHVWYSHRPTLEYPDYALFDLDPTDGCTMKTLATVALEFADMLSEIGLKPLVKTTGGSGLHVVIPLQSKYSYDAIKQFAEIAARRVAHELPKLTTLERSIARPQRHGAAGLGASRARQDRGSALRRAGPRRRAGFDAAGVVRGEGDGRETLHAGGGQCPLDHRQRPQAAAERGRPLGRQGVEGRGSGARPQEGPARLGIGRPGPGRVY